MLEKSFSESCVITFTDSTTTREDDSAILGSGLYSSHVSICGSPVTYGWPLRTWWEGRQGFNALPRLLLLNNNKNPNITGMILGHLESPPSPRDPGNWSYAKHQSQRRQAWSQMGTGEQLWPVCCGYLETDPPPPRMPHGVYGLPKKW